MKKFDAPLISYKELCRILKSKNPLESYDRWRIEFKDGAVVLSLWFGPTSPILQKIKEDFDRGPAN